MSDEMHKVAVRADIRELEGASTHEACEMFCKLFGEPDEKYADDDGTVTSFWYDPEKHNGWHSCHEWEGGANKWGIEKVLSWEVTYKAEPVIFPMSEIYKIDSQIRTEFLFPNKLHANNTVIAAYVYYNGTDEPVSFAPTFTSIPPATDKGEGDDNLRRRGEWFKGKTE